MTEDFLHYIWKYRLYRTPVLRTTAGESLEVLHPGQHNMHAGPDFMDARIRLDGRLWAGQVEVHVRASDWARHEHTGDGRYANVILHVVYDDNTPVHLRVPGDLPVLVIRSYMADGLEAGYRRWQERRGMLPCAPGLHEVPPRVWIQWKDRLLISRLERKSDEFLRLLDELSGDWEEAFYRFLARALGFRVNAGPFDMLARSLPRHLVLRHRADLIQVEALFLGQAGWLSGPLNDAYPVTLSREFEFLRRKYGLVPLARSVWNTGRIRPANHPCLRIVQLARLSARTESLWDTVLSAENPAMLIEFLRMPVDSYWAGHLWPDDPAADREIRRTGSGAIGRDALSGLMINTVAVALAAWGIRRGDHEYLDKSVKIIEFCNAERNAITRNWQRLGVACAHAGDSQALIELTNQYCIRKACLNCMVGHYLIREVP